MNFSEIAHARYSCRHYDSARPVEPEKLQAILTTGVLAPSACNGQPYHITVCRGNKARQVARAAGNAKINAFAAQAPILLVISEKPYSQLAVLGAKLKHNDYRSIDIGILAAYITAEATAQGLGTCILGWFNNDQIRKICHITGDVRLIITVGYPLDEPRPKKRKEPNRLITDLTE